MNLKRTYLALAGIALAGSSAPFVLPPLASSAALFESRPLDASRFAVLARPVGAADWNLLVLEQIQTRPLCWQPRADGLIDPTLNRFDFTGICSRYLDSNGYSLRIADQDVANDYRLRLQQIGQELQLQASSPDQPELLVVGRATVPLRDRDAFVAIQLEPGWELQRRAFGGQTLSHIYFANTTPLDQLIARSSGRGAPRDSGPALSRLERATAPWSAGVIQPRRQVQAQPPVQSIPLAQPGRTIALQVIPFRE
ncbi:MAG: DUF3747 domain-containing protein [Synechococcaceae cyanobacterium]|nr:DUF3747 domain-containing protein [Synechococcaceae cyanobacterium]